MNVSSKPLGILLLDTSFPRIPGDVGNPESYSFPVILKVVPGATVARVLYEFDSSLKEAFIQSAQELAEQGAIAITSSCGFLSIFQADIARSVSIPVFLSSLLQIPLAYLLTQRRVGIITAHSGKLSSRVLAHAAVSKDIPIAVRGLETVREFREPFLDGDSFLDRKRLEKAIVTEAIKLHEEYPDLGSLVLECHNLAPYSQAIHEATHLPTFDIIDFAEYVYSTVSKRGYSLS
ncbi:MAG: aspartate/glutamate racemase family protein [Anaerolineales bacterium]